MFLDESTFWWLMVEMVIILKKLFEYFKFQILIPRNRWNEMAINFKKSYEYLRVFYVTLITLTSEYIGIFISYI